MDLANAFHGSREATLRRYAETTPESLAVSYFTWKLKPTQQATIGNRDQRSLFGESADETIRDALRLRIEYTVLSPSFRATGHFLPVDKSVESNGPIYQAALTGEPAGGESYLILGKPQEPTVSGPCRCGLRMRIGERRVSVWWLRFFGR